MLQSSAVSLLRTLILFQSNSLTSLDVEMSRPLALLRSAPAQQYTAHCHGDRTALYTQF